MSTATSRERDRASLKDLAKLAGAPPANAGSSGAFFGTPLPKPAPEPDAKQENSGMIHLGALAAAEDAAAKASSPVSLPSLDREAMSTMRSAGSIAPAKPAEAPKKKSSSSWVTMGGLLAAAAVAAGVFFGMQRAQRSAPLTPAAVATVATPAAPAVLPRAAQTPTPTPVPPADQGVDPSTLPPAQVAGVVPRPSVSGPSKPGGSVLLAATSVPTAAPTLVATIPAATAPAPTSSDQNLQSLMQQAAGSSPTATPAAAATADTPEIAPGSVPFKPSQGAIQGSLGAARPGARACLGADDPISHATITFKSDGSVQSVSISGGAVGKPAEGCIRSALMKARVAPFAQPTFTATTTVRPN